MVQAIAAAGLALAVLAAAEAARAQSSVDFALGGSRGSVSGTECFEGLCVSLIVRELNVNRGRSRICADFVNGSAADWRGGYRLTYLPATDTFASMTVRAGAAVRQCETLPVVGRYRVVLRQNRRPG